MTTKLQELSKKIKKDTLRKKMKNYELKLEVLGTMYFEQEVKIVYCKDVKSFLEAMNKEKEIFTNDN